MTTSGGGGGHAAGVKSNVLRAQSVEGAGKEALHGGVGRR